jgi:hypothetical protein
VMAATFSAVVGSRGVGAGVSMLATLP